MPHEFTDDERARGRAKRAENYRQKREAAEDLLADALERAAKVLVEAMEAQATVYAKDGDTYVETDHRIRVQAADKVLDRIVGKARQTIEHTGEGGGPVVVEHEVDVERALAGLAELGLIRRALPEADDGQAD
jgi:hypothetical protein